MCIEDIVCNISVIFFETHCISAYNTVLYKQVYYTYMLAHSVGTGIGVP